MAKLFRTDYSSQISSASRTTSSKSMFSPPLDLGFIIPCRSMAQKGGKCIPKRLRLSKLPRALLAGIRKPNRSSLSNANQAAAAVTVFEAFASHAEILSQTQLCRRLCRSSCPLITHFASFVYFAVRFINSFLDKKPAAERQTTPRLVLLCHLQFRKKRVFFLKSLHLW